MHLISSVLLLLAVTGSTHTAAVNDPLHRIKRIVLLVMENRSFDNYFGYLDLKGLDNLLGKNLYNLQDPTNPNSTKFYTGMGQSYAMKFGPGHNVGSVTTQLYGTPTALLGLEKNEDGTYDYPTPDMSGFMADAMYNTGNNVEAAATGLISYTPADIPIITTLAKEFAVSDRWFSSVVGPTQPNRAYIHSATSHGEVTNHFGKMTGGYPQKTIYQKMVEAGKDFKVYFHDAPSALLYRWLRRPDIIAKHVRPYKPFLGGKGILSGFVKDCKEGNLPELTFLEPRYFDTKGKLGPVQRSNDDSPPNDIRRGQNLIKEVYETLRNSPLWEDTLLMITYDEHGGLYDHVPPPVKGVPNPDGLIGDGNNLDRLGVRVPTLFISPWIKKGSILHDVRGPTPTSQYEHASIAATLKKLFNWDSPLTRRDAWAATFDHLWTDPKFAESKPRKDCPTTLPGYMEINGVVEDMYSDNAPSEFNLRRRDMDLGEDEVDNEPVDDMQEALVGIVAGLTNVTLPEDVEMMTRDKARDFVMEGFRGWMSKNQLNLDEAFIQ
jgi:phospholipase C